MHLRAEIQYPFFLPTFARNYERKDIQFYNESVPPFSDVKFKSNNTPTVDFP